MPCFICIPCISEMPVTVSGWARHLQSIALCSLVYARRQSLCSWNHSCKFIKYTCISLDRACTMFLCSIQIKCEKWLYLKDGVLHIVDLNTCTISWGLARQQCFKPKQKGARLKYQPNYLCEKVWWSGRTASALAKTVHWNAWICRWKASRFRHLHKIKFRL